MAGVKIYPTGDPTALPVPGEPNMAGHDTPHDTPAKGSSFASAGREEELKRDLAQRVPGLEQLAEIPGVVPASEERPPGPGESGYEAVFGADAPRLVRRRELWFALFFFLVVAAIPLRNGLRSSERVLFGLDSAMSMLPWSEALRNTPGIDPADLGPKNGGLSDQAVNFYPFHRWVSRSYLSGDLPFWNPLIYCGAPAFANPQSGVFDPQVWLLVLGEALGGLDGFHYAMSLAALLRLFLAGLGAYLLARRLGLGARGALLAGIAFQFSGYMVLWLNFPLGHVPPFLPWILYFLEGLLGTGPGEASPWPRRRAFVGAALAMTLAVLGGHPETSFFVGLTAGVWSLALLLRERRAGLLALAALAVGSVLTAPLLLAFWSYLSVSGAHSIRSAAQAHVALQWSALLVLAVLFTLLRFVRLALSGPPQELELEAKERPRRFTAWTRPLALVATFAIVAGGLLWFLGHGLGERFFVSFVHDLWGQPGHGDGYVGPGTSLLEAGSSFLVVAAFLGAAASVFAGTASAVLRRRGWILAMGAISFALAVGLPGALELYRQIPLIGLGDTVRFAPVAALMLGLLAGEGLERANLSARLASVSGLVAVLAVAWFLGTAEPTRPVVEPLALESPDSAELFGVYARPGERFQARSEQLEGWFDGRLDFSGVQLHLTRLGPDGAELESIALPLEPLAVPTVPGVKAPPGARFFRSTAFQTSRLAEGWWSMRLDFLGPAVSGAEGVALAQRELGLGLVLRPFQPRAWSLLLLGLVTVAFAVGRRAEPLLLGLTLVQALSFAEGQNPDYPAAAVFPETRTEVILARELGPWRYFSEFGVMPPDTGLVRGLACLDGYDAIDPRSYNETRRYALRPGVHPLLGWNARGAALDSPIFQMLGVKCLVLNGPLGEVPGRAGWELIARPAPAGTLELAETWIYRARAPWPRAWIVTEATTPDEVQPRLATWDPRKTAILQGPWEADSPATSASAGLLSIRNNRVELEVEVDGDALLILSDQYFRGAWFEVDGERREARPVNGLFVGTELFAGDRHVTLFR